MSIRPNQSLIDEAHRLKAQGLTDVTIGRRIGVDEVSVRNFLKRASSPGMVMSCSKCGEHVGTNRARLLSGRGEDFRFCPDCHGWLVKSGNLHRVNDKGFGDWLREKT